MEYSKETIEKVREVMRTTDINYSPYYGVLPRLINERNYKRGIEIGVFTAGNVKSMLSNPAASDYDHTVFADIGDMESDPFIKSVMHKLKGSHDHDHGHGE